MNTICNGRDNERIPLYKQVPLKIPFSIGLAVSDFCNFRCVYCKHSQPASGNEKMLSWDEFVHIGEEIKQLYSRGGQKAKVVSICGTGEPLTNKLLPEMIKYCKDHDLADRIELTTNGSLLTHELSQRLIEAGLTRLLVSVQGINAEEYRKVCGYDIDYEHFVDELRYFYANKKDCSLYIKTVDIALKDGEQDKFYDLFSPIADVVNIESVIDVFDGVDYSNLVVDKNISRYGYKCKVQKVCTDIFMRMLIETNGLVGACGCHYPPLYIGNIQKQHLSDIWNGEVHKKYMKMHLSGRRNEIPLCADCDTFFKSGHPADNLDEHADEILKLIGSMN